MKSDNTEKIREKILSLIESEHESDASFEREMGLADKTVNNWRRGRSASFMKMLPELSEAFKVNIGELLDIPVRKDTSELSEEELNLLYLYRKSRVMPEKMRKALRETLQKTIEMYVVTYSEIKAKEKSRRAKK